MADILSGIKNKVAYNIHKATYDPDAEKFAKENAVQDKKQKEEAQKKKEDEIKKEKATEAAQTPSQKAARIGKTIASKTLSYVTLSMGIFLAIVYAMIVSNILITEPWAIRLFAFVAVLLLSIFNPVVFGILTIYFLSTGIYNKTRGKTFLPPIFAMLPITTTPRIGTISSIFNYPFFYPKGQESQKKLKEIMENYKSDLKSSFIDFERLSASYPIIKKAYDEFSKKLEDMNTLKAVVAETSTNINSATDAVKKTVSPGTGIQGKPVELSKSINNEKSITSSSSNTANPKTNSTVPASAPTITPEASGPQKNSSILRASVSKIPTASAPPTVSERLTSPVALQALASDV